MERSPVRGAPERIRGQRILSVLRGKPVSSPSRRRTAQLRYDYGPDAVRFFAVVRDKKTGDVLAEVPMVETEPHELRYLPYLGRIRWASEEVLELVPRDKSLARVTRPLRIGGA